MFAWLRRLLGGIKTTNLPIVFEVDEDETGVFSVAIYKQMDGARERVVDYDALARYGYSEIVQHDGERVIYALTDEDAETLLALKSLNPAVAENGSLRVDMLPPQLLYLRKNPHVAESPRVREITVTDIEEMPEMHIAYDAQQGLDIRTGYRGSDGMLERVQRILESSSGDYARTGKRFIRLPSNLGSGTRNLLEGGHYSLATSRIPEFFVQNIAIYRRMFKTVLVDQAQGITVIDTGEMPEMQIAYNAQKGLDIYTGYRDEYGVLTQAKPIVPLAARDYVLAGRRIIRLPASLSNDARKLLEEGHFSLAIAKIPEFFVRNLVIYKKDFKAVLVDQANRIHIVGTEDAPLRPVVTLDHSVPGWLDFKVHYEAGDMVLPYELLPKGLTEKFHRVDDHTWVLADCKSVKTFEEKLASLNAIPTEEGFRVPATEFASLQAFVEDIGGREVLTEAYTAFLAQLTNFRGNPAFKLPESIESRLNNSGTALRPYQREGIQWMDWLGHNLLHGLLADDMGLGKTLQTICVLRLAYERETCEQHSLVIAPRSVLIHWERELRRCFPGIWVHRYHGPNRDPKVFRAKRPAIFVTTFDTATNDIDVLVKDPFFYVILDEATYIKNYNTKRARAVKQLNAAHRIALSGTPVENRPAELWSIFDFLMQGHLGRYGTFVREFEHRIIAGDLAASRELGRRIGPFILRRLKEDVAQDLPEKIEMTEWCELTREQRQLYGGLQDALQQLSTALQQGERVDYTASILPVLTKLKQICDHPALVTTKKHPVYGRSEKFDWIVEKLDEIVAKSEQVVLFSHYLGMLDLFEVVLNEKNIRYIRIDGSTRDRQGLIDRFDKGQAVVALCSLQATSFGINLQAANHVIHADRWWNPAVEDQATDRVHRIGQDKTVYVYRILTEGTLEERIDALLAAKRGMADRVMGATKQELSHGWTREELLEILKPLAE